MGISLPALYAISWFKRGAETRQTKKTFSCVFFFAFFFSVGGLLFIFTEFSLLRAKKNPSEAN